MRKMIQYQNNMRNNQFQKWGFFGWGHNHSSGGRSVCESVDDKCMILFKGFLFI